MQSYILTISLRYESETFDDDPDDVFELAKLEEVSLENSPSHLKRIIDEIDESDILEVTVRPN